MSNELDTSPIRPGEAELLAETASTAIEAVAQAAANQVYRETVAPALTKAGIDPAGYRLEWDATAAGRAGSRIEAQHPWLTEPLGDSDSLALHLASEHADVLALDRTYADNVAAHDAEHDGPGTIRNHDRAERTSDGAKILRLVEEVRAEDGGTASSEQGEVGNRG